MAEIAGQCRCGAVRYTSPGPVLWAGHCHCDNCRRATSSPMTSFFGVRRAGIRWTGDLVFQTSRGGRMRRGFCPSCGSQMTCMFDGWPDEAHLYAATLDDPATFVPLAHFHYAERLDWLPITDDLPKYPGSADTTDPL